MIRTIKWFVAAVVVLLSSSPTWAETFRVYHVGNSLTGDLFSKFRTLASAQAEQRGDTYEWGVYFRPGTSLTWLYQLPADSKTRCVAGKGADYTWHDSNQNGFVRWADALQGQRWDVVTFQPYPGGEPTPATLESDASAINGMIATARANAANAHTRFFIYGAWPAVKFEELDSYSRAYLTSEPESPAQRCRLTGEYFKRLTDTVRHSNAEVSLIPAGEVFQALDAKMRAGEVPGFTSIRQLYRDAVHLNSIGTNVAGYTAYATIFQKNPVGLANLDTPRQLAPPFAEYVPSKDALKIMQQTVWEVVASEAMRPYTGVSGVSRSVSKDLPLALQLSPNIPPVELKQPGVQTINLGRLPYGSQKAGRFRCVVRLDRGDTAGSLVLRMLDQEGTDLAPQAKLMGFTDPTRQFDLKGLKAGQSIEIAENIVTATGTASVSVELRADVKTAPSIILIETLTLEERGDEGIEIGVSEENEAGQLSTAPAEGFVSPDNLVPAMDATEGDFVWRATGNGAARRQSKLGQTSFVISEQGGGQWESPVIQLEEGTKQLNLRSFLRFDELATPFEHPFQFVFRDAQGNELALPRSFRNWRWGLWTHAYGHWIPAGLTVDVPPRAASVQLSIATADPWTPPWQDQRNKRRNNFIAIEVRNVALWSVKQAVPTAFAPFDKTDWAGGVGGAGPFTTALSGQENSVVLTTHINTLNNLNFKNEGHSSAPRAWVENYLPIRRTVTLDGTVFDWEGKAIGKVAASVELEPFENKDVELPVAPADRVGVYSINLDARQDGAIVGQGVIRWAMLNQPSDRTDRHDPKYPFFFHPLFNADEQGYKDADRIGQEARALRAMGVRGVRLQCRLWGFDAAQPERSIANVREMGDQFRRQVWPYLQQSDLEAYISFFPRPSAPVPTSDAELAAWREYMAATVTAYPEISTFVFGNEEIGSANRDLEVKPMGWGYTGSLRDFIRQFMAAREAALNARPDIIFIPGQASDALAKVAQLFFEGGVTAKDIQGWALNSYGNTPATWENLTNVMTVNGADVSKLMGIIPEVGLDVQARGPARLGGERNQAINVVTTHVQTLSRAPWLQNISWFVTAGRGRENHTVFDGDWSPKPSVGAYTCMTSTLGAGRPTRVAELPGVNAYLWERTDGSKVGILWATGQQRVRLNVGEVSGPVIIRDLMGNDTTVVPEAGVISLDVSEIPIYVLNIETLGDGSEVAVDWTIGRAANGGRDVKAVIRNRSSRPIRFDGRFDGPPEVLWLKPNIQSTTLAPGQVATFASGIILMDEAFSGWKSLSLRVNVNGSTAISSLSTSLLTARRVTGAPSPRQWEAADFVSIGQVRQVINQHGPTRWSGPEDLSARCGALWDKTNFYFRAEVKDDINVQSALPEKMYVNDCIQLAFNIDSVQKASEGVEIGLGAVNGRPAVYRFNGKARGLVDVGGGLLKVTRNEAAKTTIYEAAIPWKTLELDAPAKDARIRFGILVNDSDRPNAAGGDRQAIQWFSGIFSKDTAKFGDLTFSD